LSLLLIFKFVPILGQYELQDRPEGEASSLDIMLGQVGPVLLNGGLEGLEFLVGCGTGILLEIAPDAIVKRVHVQ
jgi:hypothetical protein